MSSALACSYQLQYCENFLSGQCADDMLSWLLSTPAVCWQREHFTLFGKSTPVPRQLAWFGDAGINYRYTGIDHIAQGWPSRIESLRRRVETFTGLHFNFVLLNRYDHGAHHMGWHRDDERAADPMIASLSVGAVRRFRIAQPLESSAADSSQGGPQPTEHIDLQSGSLLTFDGRRRHQLSKTKRAVTTRINLTFRHISTSTSLADG